MTKWTLPEGRKPLTDADYAALQARVAELEAKLAKAVVLLGQWRLASAGHVSVRSVIDKHDATFAELTGGKTDD